MASNNYRYYRLDSAGHLDMAEWFGADDDDDAIEQIRAKHPDSMCEIWEGKRYVGRVAPGQFSPDDADLQNAVGIRLSKLARRIRLGLEP